ncbi:PIG-L family deacetylase [Brasilonema octagenarum UFV-E1]|uniref:PIG-L family deacetylase n=1 Tax=Brasilonema sennae CENA114 TaxID=415709 RepID=A0A856MJK2_9CYAN|nr:PIG-L deacetylase family protein [Brasilonema sennae]QDL11555.1 PIG-L family deacetylase [Brasilonema sennae CENA114]QDL17936.1 PIG-L family deacetylase [Brasilonema octagenarum UFV-E1]
MLKFDFERRSDLNYKVLCLGAHCDDIEIGCGGTILRLIEKYPNLIFYWVVFSSNVQREKEAYNSANKFLEKVQNKKILIQEFQDGFLPFLGSEVKQFFEQLKRDYNPDIIFTHYRHDLHQDHRLISDFTWNTFRNHLILEYEIPKYDGDLGNPNFFVHLNPENYQNKVKHILESFPSQNSKEWFTEETFLSLLRLRGMESNAPSKYAEGFYCRKVVF